MTRWNLSISESTDRSVRMWLARRGMKKGDLSAFVDRAVRRAVFDETVRDIKERNRDADPEAIQRDIDAALEEVRATRP